LKPHALQKKTPARRHSGWGFQRYRQPPVGGGRYIKATVGRVARHVPICHGELLSTLTPRRSAYSKFICGADRGTEAPRLEIAYDAASRSDRSGALIELDWCYLCPSDHHSHSGSCYGSADDLLSGWVTLLDSRFLQASPLSAGPFRAPASLSRRQCAGSGCL